MDTTATSSLALDLTSLTAATLLSRRQAAAALTAAGFRTAPSTLDTLASRGGGPVYRRYGPRVVYAWADLLNWAQSKLSQPVRSTAELDVPRAGKPRLVAPTAPTLP